MNDSWRQCIEKIRIEVFDGDDIGDAIEPVIKELSLEISVNGRELVSLACSGLHLEELTAGWLRSEGIISSRDDIKSIDIAAEPPRAVVTLTKDIEGEKFTGSIASSGGRGVSKRVVDSYTKHGKEMRISPRQVLVLMRGLMQSAKIHDVTRGTHCSAIAEVGRIIAAREDIGRHNTIDMLGGYCLLNGIDCSDKALLTTGRVSSEIITKACRIGVPLIISHSAATSRAVALAGEAGITLVGYVRGGRFRIYAGGDRITAIQRKKAKGAKGTI